MLPVTRPLTAATPCRLLSGNYRIYAWISLSSPLHVNFDVSQRGLYLYRVLVSFRSVKSDCQSDCHFTDYGLIYPDKALQQLQWLRVSTWFLWQAAFLKRKLTENRGRSKMSNNVSWNHRYIYLIYWPTWMRHFLCILRHRCHILLFEYVNMIGQNIHIQLMEYDRRGCKQGHWIGGAILYPVARQLFGLLRRA